MLVSSDGEQGALVLRAAFLGLYTVPQPPEMAKPKAMQMSFWTIDERVLLARDKLELVSHGASMQAGVLPFTVPVHSIWMSRRVHVTPVRCERVLQSVAEKFFQKSLSIFRAVWTLKWVKLSKFNGIFG